MRLFAEAEHPLVHVWPDGLRVASAGLGGAVRVWEATTGKAVASRRLGAGVWRLALSPDGRYLAAAVANSPHVVLVEVEGAAAAGRLSGGLR